MHCTFCCGGEGDALSLVQGQGTESGDVIWHHGTRLPQSHCCSPTHMFNPWTTQRLLLHTNTPRKQRDTWVFTNCNTCDPLLMSKSGFLGIFHRFMHWSTRFPFMVDLCSSASLHCAISWCFTWAPARQKAVNTHKNKQTQGHNKGSS